MDPYEIAQPDEMAIPSDAPARMLERLGSGDLSIPQFFRVLEDNAVQTDNLIRRCHELFTVYAPELAEQTQSGQVVLGCLGGN